MDRARYQSTARNGDFARSHRPAPAPRAVALAGVALTRLTTAGTFTWLSLGAAACGALSSDPRQVVALDASLPDSGRIEVGDTLRPQARGLNGQGDSVAATITWATLDTAILTVVDSVSGKTVGKAAGLGRVQARIGNLRSNPLNVTVQPPLDSITALGSTVSTVSVSARSLSDSLQIQAWATPTGAQNLAARRVAYAATVYPAGGATIMLVPQDTARTSASGLAVVQVSYTGGPRPDSVVVLARARHADGTPVPGSPVHFVVGFLP
ncbi:MAG TPA: hypothetical protein VEO73_13105 [Gemmatimonadales bacterium]|nr:hypothetical protein [Gemmatimonadales bacterium]